MIVVEHNLEVVKDIHWIVGMSSRPREAGGNRSGRGGSNRSPNPKSYTGR